MSDRSNARGPKPPLERSEKPLWFAATGLAIAVASRAMRDEMIGDVVMAFGFFLTVVALVYWFFRPRHGM